MSKKTLSPQQFVKIIEHIVGDKIENIQIESSQIGRVDGKVINWFPNGAQQFDALKTCPDEALEEIGVSRFDGKLWLYPGEWYDYIPEGYIVRSISGKDEGFKRGISDNDTRYGCLPYGFIKEEVLEIYANMN